MPCKIFRFSVNGPSIAKILEDLDGHLDNNNLHVAAAPGSWKTILGLAVICLLGKPTVILAPTITIRNQ